MKAFSLPTNAQPTHDERLNEVPHSSPLATVISTTAFADIIGRASVVDGDTLELHDQRIRLHGIDAPRRVVLLAAEGDEDSSCGNHARNKAATWLVVEPYLSAEHTDTLERYPSGLN